MEERVKSAVSWYASFFQKIDHSFLSADRCLSACLVRKQILALGEYCAKYFYKKLQECIDRCTGQFNLTEIILFGPPFNL